ncbi:MAG: nucleoside 2-deoxyribosyltransferase [Candidatus Hodarchaeales archaeon]|jgi:nucleoside 2-deoxyribosyltransferase
MKVYLAGPIFKCSDSECKDWRDYAIEKLESDTLNPMDRDFRGMEDDATLLIVEGDKLDIMEADVVLANYGDKPPSSVGTAMEILFAWEQHKPVFLVTTQPKISPWLKYHSSQIFESLDEAIEYINEG